MQSVVFIESNFTGLDALKKAANAGYVCYLVTSNLKQLKSLLPDELFAGLEDCATIITVENSDEPSEILAAFERLEIKPSAVLSFSQFRLIAASRVAKALGLKATSESALSKALDKYALREAMKNAGAPSIRFVRVSVASEASDIESSVGLPCIFKPSRGHSSLGVKFVKSRVELETVLSEAKKSLATSGEIIVEEYLDGPLFSLETVTTAKGRHFAWGYTDRLLTDDFIETGATFPAITPDMEAGKQLVEAALGAIDFDFGSCHTEMIFTSNGPRIVEINPRPGGSGVCRLVERATDSDVILDYVKMHLSERSVEALSYRRSVTMRCVLPDTSGRITALPSREHILSLPGVKDVWFQRKIGDLTDESRSNFSWLFTILVEGETNEISAALADSAVIQTRREIEIKSPVTELSTCVG